MIGRLRGLLAERHDNQILIDVNGVGYDVTATMNAMFQLPLIGEPIDMPIHTVIREDSTTLFGFESNDERKLFRELIRVSGVGPKVAVAILGGMETSHLISSICSGDVKAVTAAPGVGKKTAERLIIELSDRLSQWNVSAETVVPEQVSSTPVNSLAEAESALIALGYKPTDAAKMLNKVPQAETLDTQALIRAALKNLRS